ncbi:MAG: hypothetical protein JWL89_237 [Candidatus Saccharibacteria bacterium]|nr:hypothetical protein [Candidatus Saccharibacteria bacterium]
MDPNQPSSPLNDQQPIVQAPAATNPVVQPIAAPAPVAPEAPVQQPQPAPSPTLNVNALQNYETSEVSTSTLQIIKNDPALKKQLIIAIILVFTVILSFVGVILVFIVMLKAGAKQKEMKLATDRTMFGQFAQDNGLQIQENAVSPLGSNGQLGLLDQVSPQNMQAGRVPVGLENAISASVEPTVMGTLPAGSSFSIQLKHLPVMLEDNSGLATMGINSSAQRVSGPGGIQLGVGSAFSSTSLALNSLKNLKDDSYLFHVTVDHSSGTGSVTDPEKVTVTGEYIFAELSISLGSNILVPHIVLLPLQNAYALPLNPSDVYNLQLEGNFNQYFQLMTVKGYETEVLEILEPDTMQSFMSDMTGMTVEFVGNQLNLLLPIKPYSGDTRLTLADAFSRLHNLAVKYEPWLKKRFATWHFEPQPLPYHMEVAGLNKVRIVEAINTISPDHITWQQLDPPAASSSPTL